MEGAPPGVSQRSLVIPQGHPCWAHAVPPRALPGAGSMASLGLHPLPSCILQGPGSLRTTDTAAEVGQRGGLLYTPRV